MPHNDFSDVGLGGAVRRIVLPEFDAVDVVIGEPQAAVVQMVAALARDILHGETAGDDFSRGRANGREKGLVGIGVEM